MTIIGKTISHYKILEKLGGGGMGVVYKAQDLKLDRFVALKFLPYHLSADDDEKKRFIHEARAASALDHPNICVIHEIDETEDGQLFIVMAYYEGETLKKKVGSDQATPVGLSVDSVVDIATQIAQGLAKAHEHGITHRDIKPANVMITKDGVAKILDFGLAKLAGQSRLTKTGSTLGTMAYMSPEQARGEEVDHRTDIWALGVVLYEMLTGQLPFKGGNEQAMMYSILCEAPKPVTELRPEAPMALERIVNKALAKKPDERYQQVDKMLADLKREKSSSSESVKLMTKLRPAKFKRAPVKYASLVLVIVLTVVIGLYVFTRQPSKHIQPTHKQLTFTGDASWPAISPDGQFIAYVTGKLGVQKVMVLDLAGGEPLQVYQDYRCKYLRWAPDGAELVVQGDSAFEAILIPRLGGSVRGMPSFELLCWSSDGSQIASTSSYLKLIQITSKSTGKSAHLFLQGSFTWLRSLDWSPLGNRLLFLTEDPKRYTIWTIKIDGSQQQKVVEDSLELFSPRWSGDGKAIYYLRSDGQAKSLMIIPVAPKSDKAKGPARNLLAGFPFGWYFTLSSDNKRLLYTREIQSSNLWLITLKDNIKAQTFATKQLTTGTSWAHAPAISPDGSRIAFSIGTGRKTNLFVMPIAGGQIQQLTFFNSYNAGAAWSSDGKEIAFGSTQEGKPKVWKINSNGGTPHPFMKSELSEDSFSLTWFPGADILYQRPGNNNFHLLNPQTEEEKPLVEKPPEFGWIFWPRYSPDTKSVAAYWNRLDKVGKRMPSIWLISLKDSSQVLLYRGFVEPIKWSADGKWIYAADFDEKATKILKISIEGGLPKTVVTLPLDGANFPSPITMSPDEKQIVCPVLEKLSDVWMVENFDPESELEKPIVAPALPEMKQLTYLQSGWDLLEQKKYAEAEKAFRQGLELKPKHLSLLYHLGLSLNNQRKFVEAEEIFRQAFEIAPEHSDILNGLGYLLAAQGRYAEAKTFAQKALARDSSFANYNLMAWILIAGELDIDRGMTFAKKSLDSKPANWAQPAELYPYFAIPEHTLGLAYLKKGEYEKAVQYLEQALEFAPERQAIREDLQLTRQKLQEMTKQ